MNIKEWQKACDEGWAPRRYDNASREIQITLKYNPDPNATTRHHLRDTPEQREYNDKYYELWGFEIDENGNEHFEYGKYVVFVTDEEHKAIHALSEETRKKISTANKGRVQSLDERERRRRALKHKWDTDENFKNKLMKLYRSDEWRSRMSISRKNKSPWNKGKTTPDEVKAKISASEKGKIIPDSVRKKISESESGEKHWNYGGHLSEETKKKISDNHADVSGENNPMYGVPSPMKGKHHSDETKQKMSKSLKGKTGLKGENNPMYGKVYSDEEKEFRRNVTKSLWENPEYREKQMKLKQIKREAYNAYVSSGGTLKYFDFLREIYNKNCQE